MAPMPSPLASIALARRLSASSLSARSPVVPIPELVRAVSFSANCWYSSHVRREDVTSGNP
jgi:hypothetical protein